MRWLRKLRGEDSGDEGAQPVAIEDAPACEHIVLVPRWERAEDMGKDDLASGFKCEGCGAELTPAEAASLRATEAARIKQLIADEPGPSS
jgi:hypothetical protein